MARLLLTILLVVGVGTADAAGDAAEVARIRVHLVAARTYVRSHDVSHLSARTRQRRADALEALDRYISRGVFPRRTDDAYEGRRPRFIDAFGVHCAVGFLIAESGRPELARAIDAQFEYSYVADISSPALIAWADDHGFTVDELARIQPSYSSPPTKDSIERDIEHHQDSLMLACATETFTPRLKLRATGDRRGVVTVTTASSEPFARCFAERASELERGGGAFSPSPKSFATELVVNLRTPQQVLEAWLRDQVLINRDCAPRPGATPAHATVDITSAVPALEVTVETTPTNPEINACIAQDLRGRLHTFKLVPNLAWRKTLKLPRMDARRVHDAALRYGPGIATDCYAAETTPKRLTVAITAARDDKTFAITTNSRSEPFDTCVAAKLQTSLRNAFTVSRARTEAKPQPYFRIDSAVKTEVSFAIETPTERDERNRRYRKQMQRRLSEANKLRDREIDREGWGF